MKRTYYSDGYRIIKVYTKDSEKIHYSLQFFQAKYLKLRV